MHIFMPPTERLEDYLDLVHAVEDTAEELQMPLVIEGYLPPHDPRVNNIKVTPDPGVIEVNIQPAHNWDECVEITTGVYEDARQSRLGTEKFMLDGRHSGKASAGEGGRHGDSLAVVGKCGGEERPRWTGYAVHAPQLHSEPEGLPECRR